MIHGITGTHSFAYDMVVNVDWRSAGLLNLNFDNLMPSLGELFLVLAATDESGRTYEAVFNWLTASVGYGSFFLLIWSCTPSGQDTV